MDKQVCVITGCNSGIGKETALQMARQGFEVVMLVRESEKSAKAFESIIHRSKSNSVRMEYVDLMSIDSINQVANIILEKFDRLDVLINNAGVFKKEKELSPDGHEASLMVNFYAPFLLTKRLIPLLKKTENSRIINVGSELGKKGKVLLDSNFKMPEYSGYQSYANSKLLLFYLTFELAHRLSKDKVYVNCVHPGFVNTDVFRDYPKWVATILGWFIDSSEKGARGTLQLATDSIGVEHTGKYFKQLTLKPEASESLSLETSTAIWEKTSKILELTPPLDLS